MVSGKAKKTLFARAWGWIVSGVPVCSWGYTLTGVLIGSKCRRVWICL